MRKRYNIARSLSLFIMMICFCFVAHCQVIDSKLKVILGANTTLSLQNNMYHKDGFTAPALFPNFTSNYGVTAGAMFTLKPCCSVGLSFDVMKGSNWHLDDFETFNGASAKQYVFSPTFQVHNSFTDQGFGKLFRLGLVLSPLIGWVKYKQQEQGQTYIYYHQQRLNEFKDKSFTYGIRLGAAVLANLSNKWGLYFKVNYDNKWLEAQRYHDTHLETMSLELGVFFRLIHDKNFIHNNSIKYFNE